MSRRKFRRYLCFVTSYGIPLKHSHILDTDTVSKATTEIGSIKKPLGNVQEENLPPETEKKHSSDHSPEDCNTEEAEPPPVKFKKVIKKKKISSSNSTEEKEKWTDNSEPSESDNR